MELLHEGCFTNVEDDYPPGYPIKVNRKHNSLLSTGRAYCAPLLFAENPICRGIPVGVCLTLIFELVKLSRNEIIVLLKCKSSMNMEKAFLYIGRVCFCTTLK